MSDMPAIRSFDLPHMSARMRNVTLPRTQIPSRIRAHARVHAHHEPISPVTLMLALVGTLTAAYIGLIAVVMSYGALTVSFSQSVRGNESSLASLESEYLADLSAVTTTDYQSEGYVKPSTIVYVPAAGTPETALR